MINIRTVSAQAGDDNSFTTVSGDTAIVVLVGMGLFAAPAYSCTWNGVSVTQLIFAQQYNTSGTWGGVLLNPAIGTHTLEGTQTNLRSVSGQAVYFVNGLFENIDTYSFTSASNSSGTVTVDTPGQYDHVFYSGMNGESGWGDFGATVDSQTTRYTGWRAAEEARSGATTQAIYTLGGGASIAVIAMAFSALKKGGGSVWF